MIGLVSSERLTASAASRRFNVWQETGTTVLVQMALVAALASCGQSEGEPAAGSPTPSATPATRLETMPKTCGAVPFDRVADAGASLTLDTNGKEDATGDDFSTVECVLDALAAPTFVREHITSTRALDGQQEDEWSGMRARWTYHPDDGLQITFIDTVVTN